MPTSATGDMRHSGFTLIEVLVAVAILAILASVLVLSTRTAGNEPRMQREMERLQARLHLACDRAELTGRDIGLHLAEQSYGFSMQRGELPEFLKQSPLQPYTLPSGMSLAIDEKVLTDSLSVKPLMVCFSSGERSALLLRLQATSRDPEFRLLIENQGAGRIQRKLADSREWRDVATE